MNEILVLGKRWTAEIEFREGTDGLEWAKIMIYPLNKKGQETIDSILKNGSLKSAITEDNIDFHINKRIANPKNGKDDAVNISICTSRKMEYNPASPIFRKFVNSIISLRDKEIKSSRKKKR
ncbi:MAG TPA: hypothetical protein P5096_03505 [Patescibacteria group bacterium]|nr:hypothetical protein [Patescibacteria group bacterium]